MNPTVFNVMSQFIAIRVRFKIQSIENNELSSPIITYSFINNRKKPRKLI